MGRFFGAMKLITGVAAVALAVIFFYLTLKTGSATTSGGIAMLCIAILGVISFKAGYKTLRNK